MSHHIIIGNCGNHSVALLQWAINNKLSDCYYLCVDTGWANHQWQQRVDSVKQYALNNGVAFEQLQAKSSFSELVKQQNQFPSVKFQWCAGFLKGLAINEFLDQMDMFCQATILLAKRSCDSRANSMLTERVKSSEHYNDRPLWYPLLESNNEQFTQLLEQTGLATLTTRSLECDPCIHSGNADFKRFDEATIARLEQLEQQRQQTMFAHPIRILCQQAKSEDAQRENFIENMDMGCGSVWGCGE